LVIISTANQSYRWKLTSAANMFEVTPVLISPQSDAAYRGQLLALVRFAGKYYWLNPNSHQLNVYDCAAKTLTSQAFLPLLS